MFSSTFLSKQKIFLLLSLMLNLTAGVGKSKAHSSNHPDSSRSDYTSASDTDTTSREPVDTKHTSSLEGIISKHSLPLFCNAGEVKWRIEGPNHISLENSGMLRPIDIMNNTNPYKIHLYESRAGQNITGIVISCVGNSTSNNISTFLQGDVSVHYYIAKDGLVIGLVPDTERAWSVGFSARNNIQHNKANQGPYSLSCNSNTVSIWLEAANLIKEDESLMKLTNNYHREVFSTEQVESLNSLVTHLARKHNIISPFNIFTYSDCAIDKIVGRPLRLHPNNWPGPFIPFDKLTLGAYITQEELNQALSADDSIIERSLSEFPTALVESDKKELTYKRYFMHLCKQLGYFLPDDADGKINIAFYHENILRFQLRFLSNHLNLENVISLDDSRMLALCIKIALKLIEKYGAISDYSVSSVAASAS